MYNKVPTKYFFPLIILVLLCSNKVNFGQVKDSQLNNNDYLLKSGIAFVGTTLMFLVDKPVRRNIHKNNNAFLDIGHGYGEFYYSLGLSGTLYLSQFILKDQKIAATGKALFESLIVGGIVSISIKYIFGRSRPYIENKVTDFNWFETKNIFNSLPSGHVITAFTTSTILSKSIDNIYASIILYGISSLTAYQRMSSDNHWFSDAFLGASIGILVGEYFGNKIKSKNENNYNLIPFFSTNSLGFALQINI